MAIFNSYFDITRGYPDSPGIVLEFWDVASWNMAGKFPQKTGSFHWRQGHFPLERGCVQGTQENPSWVVLISKRWSKSPKVNQRWAPGPSWTYGFFLAWFFLPSRDQIYCSLDSRLTRLPESSRIFLETASLFSANSAFLESIEPPGGCRLHPNLHKKDPRGCWLAHFWWASPAETLPMMVRSLHSDRSIDR